MDNPFEEPCTASEEKLQMLKSVHGIRMAFMEEHDGAKMTKSDAGVKASQGFQSYQASFPLLQSFHSW